MMQTPQATHSPLFSPKSIVIVGASESLSKPGGKVLKNIVDHGYKGILWVVNPNASSVYGQPSFRSIRNLPAPPDLALIAIPAPFVVNALEDLARKGTKAVIILTAGFGEISEKGREAEQRMCSIAKKARMVLIGPNCSGFMTPHYSGKFAGIIPQLKPRSVDIISGSGAMVDLIMEQAVYRGLSFCNVMNVGNSAQTGVEDLVALYDESYGSDSAPILMLYLESLRKPGLLLQHARSLIEKGCAIVGIKSGLAGAGARAAASHTGAMATDDVAVEALFNKAGIIRVKSKAEMIDVACVLSAAGGRLAGSRVCVITDAGGPGVIASDEIERQGLELPVLGDKTRNRLHQILPAESSVSNPIDCFPTRTAQQLKEMLRILQEEERGNIDVIALMVANPGLSANDDIYREVSLAMDTCTIPVIPVLSSTTTCAGLIKKFTEGGKCYFQDEVPLGAALGMVVRRPRIHDTLRKLPHYKKRELKAILTGKKGILDSATVYNVLAGAGFKLPRQVEISSKDELPVKCREAGYPLAMKVVGPLHKTELGGVKIGILNEEDALSAWDKLIRIEGATGVLAQQMAEGTEVILGVNRADHFGHLVMFGLGGIYAEALKDVQFGLAPLARDECIAMVRGIKGSPILQGLRGQKGMSIDLLTDYIERLGRLVSDFPAIREVDLNPVKGSGNDLYVVDARIILDVM